MTTDINLNLQELLRDPRETLSTEIKTWIDPKDKEDRAIVAKSCIALANHGGGHLIIGLAESGNSYIEADNRPSCLDGFNTDWANDVVGRFAEPSFHCEVRHVRSPQSGDLFPIVSVPGGHAIPIVAKRSSSNERTIRQGSPYIRRPGPKSEPPQSAREWQELMRRCIVNGREEMLDQFRAVLSGQSLSPTAMEAREDTLLKWRDLGLKRWRTILKGLPADDLAVCSHGFWTVVYRLIGEVKPRRGRDLVEAVRLAEVRHTGWPEWWVPGRADIDPYPIEESVECWLARDGDVLLNDPSLADFWRAHPEGQMFLLRGYSEDALEDTEPESVFSLTTPVWRVGESLLHARNLAEVLAPEDDRIEIEIVLCWKGLRGRRLEAIEDSRYLSGLWESNQDSVESRSRYKAADFPAALPEAVRELTLPLYDSFAFFRPPTALFSEELASMRSHRF